MKRITSQEEFDYLVGELENEQYNNPKGYQRKVIGLAFLGNIYLWLMVIIVLIAVAVCIALMIYSSLMWAKLLIVIVPIAYVVITALFVKFDPPDEGIELDEEDAPALFEMIEDLQESLDAPRFHHVLITNELNAAVVQTPKFGLIGGSENYLIIGLPLMQALTVQQLKAVLAHEFGHLSKSHARLFNWIYRQRLRLEKIMATFEDRRSVGDVLIGPFLNWYIPYFNAYSFPLARANEYEADKIAAELTSPQDMAQALVNVEVIASYRSEKFWQGIFKHTKKETTPKNITPNKAFSAQFTKNIAPTDSQNWLEHALKRKTDTSDTHPSLTDRLSALNAKADFKLSHDTKADSLLGDSLNEVVTEFDLEWQQEVSSYWREQHGYFLEDKKAFEDLQTRQKSGETLSEEEHYDRVRLARNLELIDDAKYAQHLNTLYQCFPQHAPICFSLGYLRLEADDESGIQLLQRAMDIDSKSTESACEVLRDYFWRKGNKRNAEFWHERMQAKMHENYEAYIEDNQIHYDDNFLTHNLPTEKLEKLRLVLDTIAEVKEAHLVTRMEDSQNRLINVLAFKAIGTFEGFSYDKIERAQYRVEQMIHEKVQADILVLNFDGEENEAFYKKLKKVSDSKIK